MQMRPYIRPTRHNQCTIWYTCSYTSVFSNTNTQMNKIQTQIYIHYMFIVHPHKFTDRAKIKVEYVTCVLSRYHALQLFTNIQIYMFSVHFHTWHNYKYFYIIMCWSLFQCNAMIRLSNMRCFYILHTNLYFLIIENQHSEQQIL